MRKSLTSGWGIFFCTRIAPTSPQSPPQEEPPWVAPKGRLRRRGLAASATPPQKRWLVKNSLDLLFRFTLREISKWLTHLTSTQTRLSHPPGSLMGEVSDGPSDLLLGRYLASRAPRASDCGLCRVNTTRGGFCASGIQSTMVASSGKIASSDFGVWWSSPFESTQ